MGVKKNRDKNGELGNHKPYHKLLEIISKTELDKNITFEVLLKISKWDKAISDNETSGFKLLVRTRVDCAYRCDEF